MSEKIKVLLSEEEVDARIQQVAAKISKDYAGKEVHLICVLKGGVFSYGKLKQNRKRLAPLGSCERSVGVRREGFAVIACSSQNSGGISFVIVVSLNWNMPLPRMPFNVFTASSVPLVFAANAVVGNILATIKSVINIAKNLFACLLFISFFLSVVYF